MNKIVPKSLKNKCKNNSSQKMDHSMQNCTWRPFKPSKRVFMKPTYQTEVFVSISPIAKTPNMKQTNVDMITYYNTVE